MYRIMCLTGNPMTDDWLYDLAGHIAELDTEREAENLAFALFAEEFELYQIMKRVGRGHYVPA